MVAPTRTALRTGLPPGRALWHAGLLLAGLLISHRPAPAEEPPLKEGLFISVRSPITSERVNRVKSTTERALHRTDRPVRTLIYDFNPGRQPDGHQASSSQEYGPCADLAEYLLELS